MSGTNCVLKAHKQTEETVNLGHFNSLLHHSTTSPEAWAWAMLSSINEENVPAGVVFVKPDYIHAAGKVRVNL